MEAGRPAGVWEHRRRVRPGRQGSYNRGVSDNQRIGDAERDAAIEALREHMSAGRLTLDEFDERMNAVLGAKTQADLTAQFFDLPGGVPGHQLEPLSDERARRRVLAERKAKSAGVADVIRVGGIVAIWVMFFVGVVGFGVSWWLFWIPLIISGVISDTGEKS